MITLDVKDKPDPNWNKRLLSSESGTIYQTKEHALFKELKGHHPKFLKFYDGKGEIIGQILLRFYPKLKEKKQLQKFLRKAVGQKDQICKWTYGPIVFNKNYNQEIGSSLNNFLISQNCSVKGSEHPFSNELFNRMDKKFRIKNWGTFLLDLAENKEKLWNKLDKHSAKKNIMRSEEKGIYVKEMDKSDYLTFKKMGQDLGKDSDTQAITFEKQWDILQPAGYTGFLAYENDEQVGGIMIGFFNGYLNEFNIVRTERDYSAKLYSQDLLKWKIIEWAIGKGQKYYDLTGVNPEPQNEKEIGIFRYKKKWGGKLVKYKKIFL